MFVAVRKTPLPRRSIPGSSAAIVGGLPHDLLRIGGADDLISAVEPPAWVRDVLGEMPVVVLRRASAENGLLPVGVRGRVRGERFAAMVPFVRVRERITPEQIACARPWRDTPRGLAIGAIGVLDPVAEALARLGFAWGPTGSVGFELATGAAVASPASDLDLVIRAPERLPLPILKSVFEALGKLPAAIDVQVELPGKRSFALAEYIRESSARVLVRTCNGPCLTADPWTLSTGDNP